MNTATWEFVNTFAPWFSALGTIAAVVVSLYLVRARRPIKLEIRAGHRIIVGSVPEGKYPEFLFINAINVGHRAANITNVGWKTGFLKTNHAIMFVQKDTYSSGLPVKIEDGEEAKWLIPLDIEEENWIIRFSRDFLLPYPRWNLFWLRVQIHTSVGKVFEAKIEKGLKEQLAKECKKQEKING